jgi:hypothetical protein
MMNAFALPQDPRDQAAAYCATFALGSAERLDHHYEPDAILAARRGPRPPARLRRDDAGPFGTS